VVVIGFERHVSRSSPGRGRRYPKEGHLQDGHLSGLNHKSETNVPLSRLMVQYGLASFPRTHDYQDQGLPLEWSVPDLQRPAVVRRRSKLATVQRGRKVVGRNSHVGHSQSEICVEDSLAIRAHVPHDSNSNSDDDSDDMMVYECNLGDRWRGRGTNGPSPVIVPREAGPECSYCFGVENENILSGDNEYDHGK
jgi:hypothetical protein